MSRDPINAAGLGDEWCGWRVMLVNRCQARRLLSVRHAARTCADFKIHRPCTGDAFSTCNNYEYIPEDFRTLPYVNTLKPLNPTLHGSEQQSRQALECCVESQSACARASTRK